MVEIEPVDYIAQDRIIQRTNHGRYVYIFGNDELQLFDTEEAKDLTDNPLDGKPLTAAALAYIKFHADCFAFSQPLELSDELLDQFFIWYDQSRTAGQSVASLSTNPETSQAYNIVRYYLTITDFQSHFKSFEPDNEGQERFERAQAEKALRERRHIGAWLLRHSSLNRPVEPEVQESLHREGIRYYALSYISRETQINHRLIEQRIGFGWLYNRQWFTNFLDCLEYALYVNHLPYNERIGEYITIG
jgi:hypothetical protein